MARSVMVSGMVSPIPASAAIANVSNSRGPCVSPTQRNAGRPRWWRAVFGTRKSHATRSVPVPRSLVHDVAQIMAGKDPEAFVFPATNGGVLRIGNFRAPGLRPGLP